MCGSILHRRQPKGGQVSSKHFLPGVTAVTTCIRRHYELLKEAVVTEWKFGKVVDIYRSQFSCSTSSLKVSSLKASLKMLPHVSSIWGPLPTSLHLIQAWESTGIMRVMVLFLSPWRKRIAAYVYSTIVLSLNELNTYEEYSCFKSLFFSAQKPIPS